MKNSIRKFITLSDFHDLTGFYSINLIKKRIFLQGKNTPENRKVAHELNVINFTLDTNSGLFTGISEDGIVEITLT
jgi:hypothetical protein